MPPPTGVVNGPLIATTNSLIASTLSLVSHSPNLSLAFSPAKISYQAIRRVPPYAFSTAASKTRCEARQISRPVPSPSMKGIIGLFGTTGLPFWIVIFSPFCGVGTPLNEAILPLLASGNLLELGILTVVFSHCQVLGGGEFALFCLDTLLSINNTGIEWRTKLTKSKSTGTLMVMRLFTSGTSV